MKATKQLFKNIEIFITEGQLEALRKILDEPANEWLNDSLQPIVETDVNGLIVMFKPRQKLSMGLVFFFQNLMVEQRLYLMDTFLRENGMIK